MSRNDGLEQFLFLHCVNKTIPIHTHYQPHFFPALPLVSFSVITSLTDLFDKLVRSLNWDVIAGNPISTQLPQKEKRPYPYHVIHNVKKFRNKSLLAKREGINTVLLSSRQIFPQEKKGANRGQTCHVRRGKISLCEIAFRITQCQLCFSYSSYFV